MRGTIKTATCILPAVLANLWLLACGGVPPRYHAPGEWSRVERGQVPERTLRRAAVEFDGSFQAFVPPPPQPEPAAAALPSSQPAGPQAAPAAPPAPAARVSEPEPAPAQGRGVVLGPITCEGDDANLRDSGARIRELLSQRLAALQMIELHDAPEERFKDDSPRPDLARKGIRFVVKGVASMPGDNQHAIYARVVDTGTGRVALVVAGKGASADAAAEQAAERLVKKMAEVMR